MEKPAKKSVLTEEEKDNISFPDVPDYKDEERDYLSKLQQKLEEAKQLRDKSYPEFDGMSLQQYWQHNEDWANTQLKPKKNKSDIIFQTGTLEDKMMAFLSTLQNYNLSPDLVAYNKANIQLNSLGNAMEDIIDRTEELENDEEQKGLRQFELMKQGTIFLEEIWEEEREVIKKLQGKYDGKFRGVKWSSKYETKQGRAKRNILSLLSVYLGDLRQYFIEKQPHIFTVQIIPYTEAEALYSGFEMFKFVTKELRQFSGSDTEKMVNNAWRLTEVNKNQVEVIKFQDKPHNEYQIILNGVLMLPLGFPLSHIAGHQGYNIVQQNLKPIRWNFAYGRSFIFKNKNVVALLDEMIKLGLLKTQKSFMPPYLNVTGRYITQQVLMPGKITMGLTPNGLRPISDKEAEGVTNAEFNMIQELSNIADRRTASQTFTGQREPGGKPTATQIIELQRQARIMMGYVVSAAAFMEKKLTLLRLYNILQHWFNPVDKVVDQTRNVLRNRYRIVSRRRSIPNEGIGLRMTVPVAEIPTVEQVRREENTLSQRLQMPVRIIALNPKVLEQLQYTWVISVNPRPKRSSELNKILFGEMVTTGANLGLRFNPDYIEERFAEVWEEDATKMFNRQQQPPLLQEGSNQQPQPTQPRMATAAKQMIRQQTAETAV